jgi:hypothetical protein
VIAARSSFFPYPGCKSFEGHFDYAAGMTESDHSKGSWRAWFANAFAVEKPGAIDPTPRQREIVDQLCREVVRRGVSGPALMALEMSRPLNVLGASALHVLQPIMAALVNGEASKELATFLEHRGSIDFLCARIEYFSGKAESANRRPEQGSK